MTRFSSCAPQSDDVREMDHSAVVSVAEVFGVVLIRAIVLDFRDGSHTLMVPAIDGGHSTSFP